MILFDPHYLKGLGHEINFGLNVYTTESERNVHESLVIQYNFRLSGRIEKMFASVKNLTSSES
jgi:hypothetical protein